MTTDLIHGDGSLPPITPQSVSSTAGQVVDVEARLRRQPEELARWESRAEEQLREEIEEREAFDRIASELLAYIDRTERQQNEFRMEGAGPRIEEQLRAEVGEREAFDRLAQNLLAHLEQESGLRGTRVSARSRMPVTLGQRYAQIFAAGHAYGTEPQNEASQSEPSRFRKTMILARAAFVVLYRRGPRALARRTGDWLMGKRGYYLRDISSASPARSITEAEPSDPSR
jgi:hypothetical protein